jgi:hypothetical protein
VSIARIPESFSSYRISHVDAGCTQILWNASERTPGRILADRRVREAADLSLLTCNALPAAQRLDHLTAILESFEQRLCADTPGKLLLPSKIRLRGAECVNDFATPGVMNLLCRAAEIRGSGSPSVAG